MKNPLHIKIIIVCLYCLIQISWVALALNKYVRGFFYAQETAVSYPRAWSVMDYATHENVLSNGKGGTVLLFPPLHKCLTQMKNSKNFANGLPADFTANTPLTPLLTGITTGTHFKQMIVKFTRKGVKIVWYKKGTIINASGQNLTEALQKLYYKNLKKIES